ncbi:MAG: hypothetical protein IH624_01040 [Phycisphaerae bacterium]|nr:hypothetical protein [Phycisphaerae bacterium]
MKMNLCTCIGALAVCLCVSMAPAGVSGTAHDFSPGGDGSMACQFCHTPHKALAGTPLWNHKLSDRTYEIYWSTSLDAEVGQPTGSSKLCLSCHDGTVALDATVTGKPGSAFMRPGAANLGTDLSDDHPVSFVYSAELAGKDPQIRHPDTLPQEFRLDRFGEMQCVTCHDPHDNSFGHFLVTLNVGSQLCITCHDLAGWTDSIHATSTAGVQQAADPYLTGTGHRSVADNGCLSCHRPHSAGGAERLLHFAEEEKNCLSCHNGLVARKNMVDEFDRTSGHFVKDYQGVHDIKELAGGAEAHVECVDCHNPHAVKVGAGATRAPFIQEAMRAVSGVTSEGSPIDNAAYEYEVCFKCHGNNPVEIMGTISRQITQTSTLLEFERGNPSYHPVVTQGANPNVPSLVPGMDESTIIYCTDCHSADASSQVKGPHGSRFPFLLAYQYETDDNTQESPYAYELCYRCHDRQSILNDESFSRHKKHIQDQKTPCSVCHDPHGISRTQGTAVNHSNLINFDANVVFADPDTGRLEFEDLGVFRGRCYLECHGEKHSPEEYRREAY